VGLQSVLTLEKCTHTKNVYLRHTGFLAVLNTGFILRRVSELECAEVDKMTVGRGSRHEYL